MAKRTIMGVEVDEGNVRIIAGCYCWLSEDSSEILKAKDDSGERLLRWRAEGVQ